MPRLLVFQHVAYEILGTLNPLLKSYGFRIKYVNFGRDPEAQPALDGYDGLVVLGGPMSVDETTTRPHLKTELKKIEEAMQRDMPILGVCLGAQLVAKVLGARVAPGPEKEIGWYDVSPTRDGLDDPLFRHFGECEKIFQWHADTFDLAAGAVHLAEGSTCANQAFRYGENVYGIQFHMEVDEPMIGRWLDNPDLQAEIAGLDGQVDPESIRRETRRHIGRLRRLSDAAFGDFAKLFGPLRRRGPHPHQ